MSSKKKKPTPAAPIQPSAEQLAAQAEAQRQSEEMRKQELAAIQQQTQQQATAMNQAQMLYQQQVAQLQEQRQRQVDMQNEMMKAQQQAADNQANEEARQALKAQNSQTLMRSQATRMMDNAQMRKKVAQQQGAGIFGSGGFLGGSGGVF